MLLPVFFFRENLNRIFFLILDALNKDGVCRAASGKTCVFANYSVVNRYCQTVIHRWSDTVKQDRLIHFTLIAFLEQIPPLL